MADLLEAAQRSGPIGDASREILEECPVLTDYEQSFWRSFGDLQTMRGSGMGVSPIPWNRIVDYCSYYGLGRTDTDIMLRVIRLMDSAYIAAVNKENASKSS